MTTQVDAIDGETPAGLPAGTVLNLYESCGLAARGVTDSRFRSVLVQVEVSTGDPVRVGYRTSDPKTPAPLSLGAIEGRWYDLKQVVVKLGAAGDRVTFCATR